MNVINAIAWVKCTVVIRILIFDKAWTRNDSWHYIPLYESNLRVFFFLYTWEICQKCWPQKWKSSNWKVAVFQIGFRNCRINSIIELILMLYLNIQTNSFVLTFFLAPALCDQLNGLESLPSTQGTWKAYSAWFTFICKVSAFSNAINNAESVRSFESSNLSKNYLQFSILQMKHIKFILFIFYKKETLL